MKKKMVCITLAIVLSLAQVVAVGAAKEDDIKAAKAQTSSQLSEANAKVNSLENKKSQITGEINKLDQDLVDVMVEIGVLEDEVTAKQSAIEQTETDLVAAEKDKDQQYQSMKKRIQYLYEKGGDTAWAQILLEADSLSGLLSKAENTQQLYDYDRESLEKLATLVQQVTDLKSQLEYDKAELETMQDELKVKKATLETSLGQKKATASDYTAQISTAQSQANEYKQLLQQQTAELKKIEEARQKAAEEAARAAAAEKKAQEEATKKAAQNSTKKTNNASKENNNTPSRDTADEGESTPSKGDSSNNNSGGGSSSSSGSGQSIVNYATQFVGNPYVWGGDSLTNGADCSGFTSQVYAHFGISIPRSSGEQRSAGREVSYSQAQPGDLICYSGHVAIYMGGGQIVHASNSAPYPQGGIKISGNAAYRTILSVRRLV